MKTTSFSLKLPKYVKSLNLKVVVHSHGWVFLKPFFWDEKTQALHRCDYLRTKKKIIWSIREESKSLKTISINSNGILLPSEKKELSEIAFRVLSLDNDLTPFYLACRKIKKMSCVPGLGAGRFLRGASFFEDAVKTLCTTNISWSGTKSMINNLVEKIGEGAFPTANQILAYGKEQLQKEIGMGYRTEFLWLLCQRISEGRLNISDEKIKSLSEKELIDLLNSIKGFGSYSVNHMLVLLHHYSKIPVDSEVRDYFKTVLKKRKLTERAINRHFDKWGKWKFLAYKCERIALNRNYIDNFLNEIGGFNF
jgi:3-methyladenine DNA glycosylase/8-oxoguanine DNA glycosylase